MAALDLFGRRWLLRVVWELRAGPLTFRELQARCGEVSPSVLNARLKELREAGLVEHDVGSGYVLTALGRALHDAFAPLDQWAERWAGETRDAKD
jgi:DNA-binding HxlR family transcriptional regulator